MARLCLRYVKDKDDVQDILAEGFIKVFKHLQKFEYKGEHGLEAWIRKIMVNECLMSLRKKRGHVSLEFSESDTELVQPGGIGSEATEIIGLIRTLPEGYRTIFNLFVIDGYSHQEIADLLGISASASRSQLTHARNKLKQLLTTHGWK
jgi:RNA polymerase sigma factor (sigma-70 family)